MKDLISDILVPSSFSGTFLRKGRSVLLTDKVNSNHGSEIQLIPVSSQVFQNDEGDTIKLRTESDTVLFFRSPCRSSSVFSIALLNPDPLVRLKDLDRLCQFFFDHKTMDPILPNSLKSYPDLYQRLANSRATLKPIDPSTPALNDARVIFSFEYSALYHTGTPLREEKTVQRRNIEIQSSVSKF
jgi:hypothetical protein